MSLAEFDDLYLAFAEAHAQRLSEATLTCRTKTPRQRAVGAGAKHRYDLRDRLLMTLFWLRVYVTYEVLGFLYDLNKTNIEDNLKGVLATLERMTTFTLERPKAERPKLRSPQAVMDAFPAVRLVIDAKEQRIQRPKSSKDAQGQRQDQQKPYYSGKKKAHTLKNQIAVRPDGRIEAVSDSVPGGATHDITLLRRTDLLGELAACEAAMLDKGAVKCTAYDGIQHDYPDVRLYQPYKARRNHPLNDAQKAYNRFLAGYRIIVEHTLAQMNRFQVLVQLFRHNRGIHGQIVRIIAGLVNRCIQVRPLKTYASA